MPRFEIDCPECGGEGFLLEWYGPGREAGYGYEPFERHHECKHCAGHGSVEPDWCPVANELPEVGEKVLVIGVVDGVKKLLDDVLVDDGEAYREAGDPSGAVWEKSQAVTAWADVAS